MRIVEDDALRSLVWLPTLICNCFCGRVASPIVQRPSMRYSQQTACVREVAFAMFEFQIIETVEIFKDPIGHYHHWTILFGRLAEGTMHPRDLICIPAVDGTKMCARIGGTTPSPAMDGTRMRAPVCREDPGSEVWSRRRGDSFGVMVSSPAPSQSEIAMGVATGSSPEEYHELAGWALRHRPARLIHDRGPDGLGFPCPDCTRVLYTKGPVLHPNFEPALRDLCRHSDPYVARRAQDMISEAMSAAEYDQWREQQRAAKRKFPSWQFWKRR
jgi:hypothetical protein